MTSISHPTPWFGPSDAISRADRATASPTHRRALLRLVGREVSTLLGVVAALLLAVFA